MAACSGVGPGGIHLPLMRAVWSIADLSEIRPYHRLTRREREIVSPLGEGKTSKGTALKLDLSYRAVEVSRAKLRKKFGAVDANGLFQVLSGVSKDRLVNSGQGATA